MNYGYPAVEFYCLYILKLFIYTYSFKIYTLYKILSSIYHMYAYKYICKHICICKEHIQEDMGTMTGRDILFYAI